MTIYPSSDGSPPERRDLRNGYPPSPEYGYSPPSDPGYGAAGQGYSDPGYSDPGYGTAGQGYSDPGYGQSGQGYAPTSGGPDYAQTSGPGYAPTSGPGYAQTSGPGYAPTSGGAYPPPQGQGYPPSPGQGYPSSPVPPPRAKGSKAPLIVGIIAGVLLLCGGGGAGIFYVAKNAADEIDAKASASASARSEGSTEPSESGSSGTPSPSSTDEEVHGDLNRYKAGDCLTIDSNNNVKPAKCTDTNAYKVLSRHDKTANTSLCGTDTSLYNDSSDESENLVLCIAEVE